MYLVHSNGEADTQIEVSDPEILIGANEFLLADLSEGELAQLHPQHARIVYEQDRWVLEDLGQAATQLNGRVLVGERAELHVGDQLVFGDNLTFQWTNGRDPMSTTQVLTAIEPLQLTLTPQSTQGPKQTLLVNSFPFIVAKNKGYFANYQAECGDFSGYLSRRHAQFFMVAGELFVEDLGSTNGTILNNKFVEEGPIAIKSGDLIRFGHDVFTFEVQVGPVSDQKVPEGTVLISSPGSFLDIYVDGADRTEPTVTGHEAEASPQDIAVTGLAHRLSALLPTEAFANWWNTLPIGPDVRLWLKLSPMVLVAVVIAVLLLSDNRLSKAESALREDNPVTALELASQYLQDHPDHAQAIAVSETALLRVVNPQWIEKRGAAGAGNSIEWLEEKVAQVPHHTDHPNVRLLRLISAIDSYWTRREAGAGISVVSSNAAFEKLMARWERESDANTRLLRELEEAYPTFKAVHAQTLSRVRLLQEDQRILLAAIDRLHRDIVELAEVGRHGQIPVRVDEFGEKHPGVGDVHVLRQEVSLYIQLTQAHASAKPDVFVPLVQDASFRTPALEKLSGSLVAERASALAANEQLSAAVSLWQKGRWAAAISQLEVGEESHWSPALLVQGQRYSAVVDEFQMLLGQVHTEDYPQRLIDFYTGLNPAHDTFFLAVLEEDFAKHREHALRKAEVLMDRAQTLTDEYTARFDGISGGLRLEPEVSEVFKEQASSLHTLLATTSQAVQIHRLLEETPPAPLQAQLSRVTAEINRQRVALASLRSIVGDVVVNEKLSLLPGLVGGTDE